jgi:hypothetical protein
MKNGRSIVPGSRKGDFKLARAGAGSYLIFKCLISRRADGINNNPHITLR